MTAWASDRLSVTLSNSFKESLLVIDGKLEGKLGRSNDHDVVSTIDKQSKVEFSLGMSTRGRFTAITKKMNTGDNLKQSGVGDTSALFFARHTPLVAGFSTLRYHTLIIRIGAYHTASVDRLGT